MFTGPVGPVEVFFYWPETVFGNFYWPGAIGSPLASSPGMSNLLYNINKYESPHWLSPGDATLWQDYVCPGLYNGSYGNWSVATNPCSIHLKGLYIVPMILRYQCNTF